MIKHIIAMMALVCLLGISQGWASDTKSDIKSDSKADSKKESVKTEQTKSNTAQGEVRVIDLKPQDPLPIIVEDNTETEDEVLAKIEDYIKGITTLKARFAQTAEVFAQDLTGTFYMQRPGKLRFEYDAPIKDYIVADGTLIYFYDSEMNNTSQTLVNSTLAAFLVRKDPGLTGNNIEVMDVARKKGHLGVTLRDAKEPEKGRLTLIFKEKPKLELLKWQVVDAQGYVTQIELSDVETDIDLARNLFVYVAPNVSEPGYN